MLRRRCRRSRIGQDAAEGDVWIGEGIAIGNRDVFTCLDCGEEEKEDREKGGRFYVVVVVVVNDCKV